MTPCRPVAATATLPEPGVLRVAPILLLLLTLTACWTGPALFTAADAARSIDDGHYRMVEHGADASDGDLLVIHRQPDGSLLVEGPEHPWQGIAAPLPQIGPGRFALQLVEHHPDRPERAKRATYMLLDVQGKHPAVTILHCGSYVAAAVEAAGGFVARDPQSAASCAFADQELLRRYLVEAARQKLKPDIDLVKVVE